MPLTFVEFSKSAEALFVAHDNKMISGRIVLAVLTVMTTQHRLASDILEEATCKPTGKDKVRLIEHLRRAERSGFN